MLLLLLDSGAPPGPETISRPGPLDHQKRWLARVLTQFRSSPGLLGLIRAPLGASTVLETVFWTLLTITLDNAVGVQLDVIGARFKFERDGLEDDEYRALIPKWVQAIRSSGTTPQIAALLDRLDPTNTFLIDDEELDPATFSIDVTAPVLDDAEADVYRRFVKRSRAAAIRCSIYSYPLPADQLFTLADEGDDLIVLDGDAEGTSDADDDGDGDGTDGGGLAREEMA